MSNGLLHENDVERLRELGEWQQRSFSRNLLEESHRPVELVFALDEAEDVGYLVLKEEIRNSQRVEAFEVFVRDQGEWEKVYTGTVIGYKKIIPLFKENVKEIRIVLNDYRVLPQISFVGVYPRSTESPPKEKADDLNSIKTKINHPGALQMDGLFSGFTISVHVSQ